MGDILPEKYVLCLKFHTLAVATGPQPYPRCLATRPRRFSKFLINFLQWENNEIQGEAFDVSYRMIELSLAVKFVASQLPREI